MRFSGKTCEVAEKVIDGLNKGAKKMKKIAEKVIVKSQSVMKKAKGGNTSSKSDATGHMVPSRTSKSSKKQHQPTS